MSDSFVCQMPGCERVFDTKAARGSHFGLAHDDDEIEPILLDEINRLVEMFGRPPTLAEVGTHSKYSDGPFKRVFGSWNEALQACGFDAREPGGAQGELSGWWKGGKVVSTCDWCGGEYRRRPSGISDPGFCRMRCMYDWCSEYFSGPDSPMRVDEKVEIPYGPKWPEKSDRIRSRDDEMCRACLIDEQDSSGPLQVHHITPRSTYWEDADGVYEDVDWEECDDESNLLTLCSSCHTRFEGMWSECAIDEFVVNAQDMISEVL